jgi:hypothetical protein
MRRWILLISLCACTTDLDGRTERAARRANKEAEHLRHQRGELRRQAAALAHAQIDFEELRALRVQSLRAEHSVIAVQPLAINALASVTTLRPAQRMRLDEDLVFFRQRLAETRDLIGKLEQASADQWEARDDEVGRAMAGMYLARDASWNVLEGKRDEDFPDT